jgi:hypothetical protein
MVDRLLLEPTGYLALPGAGGDKADTPDHADFAIAGDMDLRALVFLTTWTATSRAFVGQSSGGSPTLGWVLRKNNSGTLSFRWSATGLTQTTADSTVVVPITTGALWIRATFDVDNGAVGNDVTFYTSTDPVLTAPASVAWTQLGATVTTAGIATQFDNTVLPTIGSLSDNLLPVLGRVFYAEVRNGIAGTIVADPDFRDADQYTSSTSLTDTSGKVWTVRGAASWSLPAATDSYQLEDASGILVLESSVPDVFIPYTNPMPQLLAQ